MDTKRREELRRGRSRAISRRRFLGIAAGLGAATITAAARPTSAPAQPEGQPTRLAQAPIQAGKAKPFAGVRINAAVFSYPAMNMLKAKLPDFEEKTGIKCNLEILAWQLYNQRADLELSTRGSAYDVLNITFPFSGRWIGAGWFTPLDEFLRDPNRTPPDWGVDDFPEGVLAPTRDKKGNRYGIPWDAAATILIAGRADLIEKAGFKLPTTWDQLMQVAAAVNDKEGVKAFIADKLHNWNWVPILMSFGGTVMKNPPDNVTPTLYTPEAVRAAEYYGKLMSEFAPEGVTTYGDDETLNAQLQGRANMRIQTVAWGTPVGDPAKSKVAGSVRYAFIPSGPKGAFPCTNTQSLGIPVGSKKKDAGWEFIKWALSKEMVFKSVLEVGHGGPGRTSVINSPEFKQKLMINGDDLSALFLKAHEIQGKTRYMAYRTVPEFPIVGDKIHKAIEKIITKQMSADAALKQAQEEAIADLKKAGAKIDA